MTSSYLDIARQLPEKHDLNLLARLAMRGIYVPVNKRIEVVDEAPNLLAAVLSSNSSSNGGGLHARTSVVV